MTTDFAREDMLTVQEVLDRDPTPPPPPFRESSPRSFGLEDLDIDRYFSQEFHDLEMERLWSRVWQWACREEDIPNVGDHTIYEIGDRSVLIVRSEHDRIQGFYNSCLHRGTQLKEDAGHCRQITCPYHAWSWNLDGSLRHIPCPWDFPQVERDAFALPEVRVDRWAGFVFVNFDDSASPLLPSLDVVPEHFKHFPLDDKFTFVNVSKVIPANWKLGMEAFFEAYHVVTVHPQIAESVGDANTQYDIWETASRLYTLTASPSPHLGPDYDEEAVYRNAMTFFAPDMDAEPLPDGVSARTGVANFIRLMMRQMMGVDLAETSEAEVIDGVEYFVFPNWFPWGGVANGVQFRFRPNGHDPDTAIMDLRLLMPCPPGQPRPPAAPVKRLGIDEPFASVPELLAIGPTLDQDVANLPRLRRGLKAARKRAVTLGDYQESRIRHFHRLLDAWLAE